MPTTSSSNSIQNRNFGVELEIIGLDIHGAARVLNAAGIRCEPEGYNHCARTYWKSVTDASLCGTPTRRETCEVVSPILNGESGLEQVRNACKALAAAGATVNKTTGLHVHVDARDLSVSEISAVCVRYAKHESLIDSFMPASRRTGQNRFCRTLVPDATNSVFTTPVSVASMITYLRNRYGAHESRYGKVNLESYLRHGSLEFRQHSGSVNSEKVSNWIRFCVNFVEQTRTILAAQVAAAAPARGRGRPRANAAATPARRGRRPSVNNARTRILNAFLERGDYNYLSLSELAAIGQISEASVPATLSAIRTTTGARIRNSRWRGYTITNSASVRARLANPSDAPSAPARTPATRNVNVTIPADDNCFLGLPESVVGYYSERIADLAA